MNLDSKNIGIVKHFRINLQKVKSFLEKNDRKCEKNTTFAGKVLYYTQNIRTFVKQVGCALSLVFVFL